LHDEWRDKPEQKLLERRRYINCHHATERDGCMGLMRGEDE
jgi:hypothetical protein